MRRIFMVQLLAVSLLVMAVGVLCSGHDRIPPQIIQLSKNIPEIGAGIF
jgi:hypothetical protein